MSHRREVQVLVRKLQSAGFSVTRTGSGHWKVQNPAGGEFVIIAFSPGRGGQERTRSRLKKIGYNP